jgi:peptide/nickel transport system substrate-binding protein
MFKRTLTLTLALSTALSLLLVLQAFINTQAKTNTAPPQPLIIGTTANSISLDPAEAYNMHDSEILYNTGSGLLAHVPGTSILAPGLAIALPQVSPDGLVYTFTLRSGLQFSDGTAFNAYDVKWSLDRVATLASDEGVGYLVSDFVSETIVVNNTTVKIILKEPTAFFPQLVTTSPYYPIPINEDCYSPYEFSGDSLCGGIGPYTILTRTEDVSITFSANPSYYGMPPESNVIIVKYFDTSTDLRQALENGEIDVAWKDLDTSDLEALQTNPGVQVKEGNGNQIRYLAFNTSTPPFDDPDVRTALAAAVDRPSYVQGVFSDTKVPLYSMVPAGTWSHEDNFLTMYGDHNLDQAKILLQQAGYSETNKLEVDLWYGLDHYGETEPDLAAAIATNFEETGMVSVMLHPTEWSEFVGNLGDGIMPVFLLGWWTDFQDPDNSLWPFGHSSSSSGMGIFYDDDTMDAYLVIGRIVTPVQGSSRQLIYEMIQEYWAEEAPTIPLLQGKSYAATRTGVCGIVFNPNESLPYFTIHLCETYLPLILQ